MKYSIDKKHVSIGIVTFAVLAACIILYFILYRMHGFMDVISQITGILMPFAYGLVMAYLLCPLYNWTYSRCIKSQFFKKGKKDRSRVYGKVFGTVVSLAALTIIVISLLWMIIPGLIDSITGIIKMLPGKVNDFVKWMELMVADVADAEGPMANITNSLLESGRQWVETTIIPGSETLITGISTSVMSILAGIKNFFIGIIICVFFLNSKEMFSAQAKKIVFAVFNNSNSNKFLYGAHFVNRTFGKFINGKLIDSFIIGMICFIFMSIVDWPYIMLISVIVGVTNIIPFFGPFIGAVPSALLILMVDPVTCLYFVIFILALQQLDGNIIGPKILGESTGIPSFWIMFAILVGGGMFGFVGMVLGIPVFACIYAYISYRVDKKLNEKGLPVNTNNYMEMEGKLDEQNS